MAACRNPRKPREELLFTLLRRMDNSASPDKPLPTAVWFSVLAAPVVQEMSTLSPKESHNTASAPLSDPVYPSQSRTLVLELHQRCRQGWTTQGLRNNFWYRSVGASCFRGAQVNK